MKTSSYSSRNVKQSFQKFFDKTTIKKAAEKTSFTKRRPKKIPPFEFVLGLIMSFCAKILALIKVTNLSITARVQMELQQRFLHYVIVHEIALSNVNVFFFHNGEPLPFIK